MPVACEENILDVPVSPSVPAANEMVMFTDPSGNTVHRTWANMQTSSVPADVEIKVAASGGVINNGETFKVFDGTGGLPNYIGRRIRYYRTKLKQTTIVVAGDSYYSFNTGTGRVDWSPAASTEEVMQFEVY